MSASIESRAGVLLRTLIARQGTSAAAVAAALGLAPAEMERLLAGADRLDLGRLERVLTHLGENPAEFFARLYAEPPAPAAMPAPGTSASRQPDSPSPNPDDPIPRREVEALLGELRSMIDGMVRVLDAERILARRD